MVGKRERRSFLEAKERTGECTVQVQVTSNQTSLFPYDDISLGVG